jgi:hypothetical protein
LIRRKCIREICSLLDQYLTSLHNNYSFQRIPLIWFLALARGRFPILLKYFPRYFYDFAAKN